MKALKLLSVFFVTLTLLSSCVQNNYVTDDRISLEELVSGYDLWYVDFHRTSGSGEVPFISRAFTLSFLNGQMYANNNIVDVGRTGNGLGILVGRYNTNGGILETSHNSDGLYDFDVTQISDNEIRVYSPRQNVTYHLIGYQRNDFDYDKLFYDNIEYFLQEYIAWEKGTVVGGNPNAFDSENFLQFTPENNTTFYASTDGVGTNIDSIVWDFVGSYTVYDVQDYDDLKILTLNYDGGDTEEFELSVINDESISLYHVDSQTTYNFSGRGFIQYRREGKSKPSVRNSGRKRTKIKRETKIRKS